MQIGYKLAPELPINIRNSTNSGCILALPLWPQHTIKHRKNCKCCPTNKRTCIYSAIKTIFECKIQCSRKPSIIFFYVIFLWWWMYSATRWRMSSFEWEVFQPGLANISIDWTWLSNSVILSKTPFRIQIGVWMLLTIWKPETYISRDWVGMKVFVMK